MSKYAWNAHDYEKHSSEQQAWARELIGKLQLEGTENILDLGCGEGKVTAELAASLAQGSVLGIDNSKEMIALAQEKYPKAHYPNLRFVVRDASAIAYHEQFEIVFSNAALHWIKDHQPLLQKIYRSLRPGGKIVLQMGGKGNASQIVSVLDRLQKQAKWRPYFTGFTFPYGFYGAEEYSSWLVTSGFQVRRATLIPKSMKHQGRSGLKGWIRTTWLPYTQRVPEDLREEFITELADQFIQVSAQQAHETIEVGMVRLEVEAYKVTTGGCINEVYQKG